MVRDEVELAAVDEASFPEVRAAFSAVFANPADNEAGLERSRHTVELDRLVAARHGGEVVGTAGNYTFQMSMPWAAPAPCAGVTMVSVRADHRRQGLLRRMMAHLLQDAVERGEPFAALWASEGPIYGRFGFGPAAPTAEITVERAHARFREPPSVTGVELVDAQTAAKRLPSIYDAVRATRHGTLSRTDAWWRHRTLADPPERREGAGEMRFAVLGDRGFAIHRLKPSWSSVGPEGTVEVQELVGLDAQAIAALWRFVIETDLSVRTTADAQPVDDPLSMLLDDPLRAPTAPGWPLQVRLVDVARALSARGYRTDGVVTFELHDASLPANAGRWRLEVVDGHGRCEPSSQPAQVELDAETLATVSLGGVRVSTLAAAGRIVVHDASAIPTLERLLATDVAPWHGGMF